MGLYQWMIDFASREAEGPLSGLDLDPRELAKEGIESMARSGGQAPPPGSPAHGGTGIPGTPAL